MSRLLSHLLGPPAHPHTCPTPAPHLRKLAASAQRWRRALPQQLHTKVALPLGPVLLGHALAALPRAPQRRRIDRQLARNASRGISGAHRRARGQLRRPLVQLSGPAAKGGGAAPRVRYVVTVAVPGGPWCHPSLSCLATVTVVAVAVVVGGGGDVVEARPRPAVS
eukprot:356644-Chlamydomonas_euryale.AAC.3